MKAEHAQGAKNSIEELSRTLEQCTEADELMQARQKILYNAIRLLDGEEHQFVSSTTICSAQREEIEIRFQKHSSALDYMNKYEFAGIDDPSYILKELRYLQLIYADFTR